jgi:hypothetical protein
MVSNAKGPEPVDRGLCAFGKTAAGFPVRGEAADRGDRGPDHRRVNKANSPLVSKATRLPALIFDKRKRHRWGAGGSRLEHCLACTADHKVGLQERLEQRLRRLESQDARGSGRGIRAAHELNFGARERILEGARQLRSEAASTGAGDNKHGTNVLVNPAARDSPERRA